MRGWLHFILFALSLGTIRLYGQANAEPVAYSVPLSLYTQQFDGLPATGNFSLAGKGPFNLSAAPVNAQGCAGWQILISAGTGSSASFAAGSGSSTGSGVYSLGAAASADRALGTLAAGSGTYAIGLVMTNQTGAPLNYFTLSFTAEQWRKGGSGNKNTWTFHYKTGAINNMDQQNMRDETHLNFSTPNNTLSAAALVGNLPENQQFVTYTVTGILWKPGEQLLLRWDDSDEAGSDDGMGLDNLSFSAGLMSQLPGVTSAIASSVTTCTAELVAVVNDNFLPTDVHFLLDNSDQFIHPRILKASPDTLMAGSGATAVTASADSLSPATVYYWKAEAHNSLGDVNSQIKSFTTLFTPPVVTTLAVSDVLTSSAVVTVQVVSGGGITEQGVVWSLTGEPTILDHKIVSSENTTSFSQYINGLPSGTMVYARAFATNAGGMSYGETKRFTTQTTILSILPQVVTRTNAAVVNFSLRMAQPVTGLSASHFILEADGISDASITSVTGNGGSFTITVNTGEGSGTIGLRFANDSGLSARVYNKPFASAAYFLIDKQAPQLKTVTVPDAPMKIGDTVTLTIHVAADPDVYKITNSVVNGFATTQWTRKNDSTYQSSFIITTGGNDVAAGRDIPVICTLADGIGNTATFNAVIHQPNDAIDANKPFINLVQNPGKGLYKMGDTLSFVYRFSEKISLSGSGTPSLALTIGNRTKSAAYISGNGSDSLLFRYVVAADDFTADGIKIAENLSLSNVQVKDMAGNLALLNFTNPVQPGDLLVDAVQPVISSVQLPPNKTYRAGDTITFVFTFSEDISLMIKGDGPLVKITIGNLEHDLFFSKKIAANQLQSIYIIRTGDLDKNGIGISPTLILNGSSITDIAGNTLVPSFKTGSLANIKVDAVSPVFSFAEPERIFICSNSQSVTISNAFAVADDEAGELVTWKIRVMPLAGSLSLASFALTSTGKTVVPAGIVYKPGTGLTGMDTLVTEITDGINTMQKTIVIVMQTAISQNKIGQDQIICEEKAPDRLIGSAPRGGDDQYKYVWETSPDSTRFFAAQGVRDQMDYLPPLLHSDTWIRRITLSGACADTSRPVKITVLKNGFWTGTQNENWNNSLNWCGNRIPVSETDVYIPPAAPYQPVITDTAFCNNLIIADGARLTITGSLSLLGNTGASPGSISAEQGTIVYNGMNAQTIYGNHFEKNTIRNIVSTNVQGVSVSGNLVCTGTITLTKGVLFTGDHLVLQQDASVGACANGTSFIGTVSLNKQLVVKRPVQLLGHPFTHPVPVQQLRDGILISGEGSKKNDTIFRTDRPAIFYYQAVSGSDSSGIDAGWKSFADPLAPGETDWKKYEGIRLELTNSSPGSADSALYKADSTGNDGRKVTDAVLHITGMINTGDQEWSPDQQNHANYHILSNPYPSSINLSRLSRGNGIGRLFWIWDPAQGRRGGYTSIPFSSNYTLPIMGAFIVKTADSLNNTILFSEQCKTRQNTGMRSTFDSDDAYFIELQLESDSIFWDRLLFIQTDSARTGYDRNDAEKFTNPDVNFYSISRDNKRLSIDSRPFNNASILPMGMQTNEKGWYTIRVVKAKMPSANTLMLHDTYADTWTSIEEDNLYTFQVTGDSESVGDKRFELRTKETINPNTLSGKKMIMSVYPVPARSTILVRYAAAETANISVSMLDVAGNILKTIPLGLQKEGQVIIPVQQLPPGVYIIEARSGNERVAQKIIKL